MPKKGMLVLLIAVFYNFANAQTKDFSFQKKLPQSLREVSGIAVDGAFIWAISDTKGSNVFKLDKAGNIVQELAITNAVLTDVEAVAVDDDYLYIADIGDNEGKRPIRSILKVKKSAIGNAPKAQVAAETIRFSFADEKGTQKKSLNNYDAEALLNYKDSLYIFTKRKQDNHTELFVLGKKPGHLVARSVAFFDSRGLVTDVAINEAKNEIALLGYQNGHRKPFVWLLTNFAGSNFFGGSANRFRLPAHIKDWQVEGIAYKDGNTFYVTCEETKDEPASFYVLPKNLLTVAKANKD